MADKTETKQQGVREQWREVCEAAMKVAAQMMRLDGVAWEADNVEYWQEEDDDSITVSGTDGYRETQNVEVPWEFVEAHLEDRPWQLTYRARIEAAKEAAEKARRVEEAALKAVRDEQREKHDRVEYKRLRKKYEAGQARIQEVGSPWISGRRTAGYG